MTYWRTHTGDICDRRYVKSLIGSRNAGDEEAEVRYRAACAENSRRLGLLVSPEDQVLLAAHWWRLNRDGYATTKIRLNDKRVELMLHVLVHHRTYDCDLSTYGNGMAVRHIDPVNHDCRRENLFEERGDTANVRDTNVALRSDNTSGQRGVSWSRARRQWVLSLKVNRVKVVSKYYKDLDTACAIAQDLIEMRSRLPQNMHTEDARQLLNERREELESMLDALQSSAAPAARLAS